MPRRQTPPKRWALITESNRNEAVSLARSLPIGSGLLILASLDRHAWRRLRQLAVTRRLMIERERRGFAARVHDLAELRVALSAETRLILLSPIFATGTHPDWPAIPPMRAAAFARLGGRRLIALGGMNERRYRQVERLGFSGWAGLSAFRT